MKLSLEGLKGLRRHSAGQKKTMFWILKFSAVVVVFLLFLFPAYRDSRAAASKRASLQSQINDLKKMSVNLLTAEELTAVKARLKDFESKLMDASRTAALLDYISTEADKNHFKLVQIYSDVTYTLKDDRDQELLLQGKKLMLLPVSFRVEADYKSFGNFLKSMKDNAPAEFVVESVDLKKASPESESLQCDITASFIVR